MSVFSLVCNFRFFAFLSLWVVLSSCTISAPPLGPGVEPQNLNDPIADLLVDKSGVAPAPQDNSALETMKFSIQVGAFARVENAALFEQTLDERGLDAFYFKAQDGLYKVRFGNYVDYPGARTQAEKLQMQGVIGRFFVVIPESYRAAQIKQSGQGDLRSDLVKSAQHFLGVPYLWGGDTQKGFDCSGLTLVCYRTNGLNLPRNSRAQYAKGRHVSKSQLKKGDLVFFAPHGGKRVTHVGIYIGRGRFIHAPRTGKTVRIANLGSKYWQQAYVGGRSYLRVTLQDRSWRLNKH